MPVKRWYYTVACLCAAVFYLVVIQKQQPLPCVCVSVGNILKRYTHTHTVRSVMPKFMSGKVVKRAPKKARAI